MFTSSSRTNSIKMLFLSLLAVTMREIYAMEVPGDLSRAILTNCSKPTVALIQLLKYLDMMPHEDLKSIVEDTQKEWLRKPGQERWHQEEKLEQKKNELIPLFQELGVISAISPSKSYYTYALILGATLQRVRTRIAYLHELGQKGIVFDQIILLGGKRPLDPEIEKSEQLLDYNNPDLPIRKDWQFNGSLPTTETEMMKMVVDQSELPQRIKQRIVIIDTPMQPAANNTLRRPNTADTMKEWLKNNPKPGSCLALSNQPYIGYQHSVITTLLPKEFVVESAGPAVADDIRIANTLDNLARWLYQEKIRRAL